MLSSSKKVDFSSLDVFVRTVKCANLFVLCFTRPMRSVTRAPSSKLSLVHLHSWFGCVVAFYFAKINDAWWRRCNVVKMDVKHCKTHSLCYGSHATPLLQSRGHARLSNEEISARDVGESGWEETDLVCRLKLQYTKVYKQWTYVRTTRVCENAVRVRNTWSSERRMHAGIFQRGHYRLLPRNRIIASTHTHRL